MTIPTRPGDNRISEAEIDYRRASMTKPPSTQRVRVKDVVTLGDWM
jgi:hypothetical protein